MYHPKMLMQMCLGYLKLSFLDPKVREFLIQKKHLTAVVKEWLKGDSSRELSWRNNVKFFIKIDSSN
jgi:hypothetical protein